MSAAPARRRRHDGRPTRMPAWRGCTCRSSAGLRRLGHDVYYFETTSSWPYDPRPRREGVRLGLRRAVPRPRRRELRAGRPLGLPPQLLRQGVARAGRAREPKPLLADADAVFNVTGATRSGRGRVDGRPAGLLRHRPGAPRARVTRAATRASRDRRRARRRRHLRREHRHRRLPDPAAARAARPDAPAGAARPLGVRRRRRATEFTTVGNWQQVGPRRRVRRRDLPLEQAPRVPQVLDLPRRAEPADRAGDEPGAASRSVPSDSEDVPALGVAERRPTAARRRTAGSSPTRARSPPTRGRTATTCAPRAASSPSPRDLNVRLRSGWFSERSACYLAAGRPVSRRTPGSAPCCPTGEGCSRSNTMDDVAGRVRGDQLRLRAPQPGRPGDRRGVLPGRDRARPPARRPGALMMTARARPRS